MSRASSRLQIHELIKAIHKNAKPDAINVPPNLPIYISESRARTIYRARAQPEREPIKSDVPNERNYRSGEYKTRGCLYGDNNGCLLSRARARVMRNYRALLALLSATVCSSLIFFSSSTIDARGKKYGFFLKFPFADIYIYESLGGL